MTDKAAVVSEGIRHVHISGVSGNYATLCGLDGDDPDEAVQQSPSEVGDDEKIDCAACRMIWEACQQFTRRDFKRNAR